MNHMTHLKKIFFNVIYFYTAGFLNLNFIFFIQQILISYLFYTY